MKNEAIKEKLIQSSFWSFFSALVSRIGGLIFTILLARFLMPAGYGIYSIVISVVMIFQTFSDLGINMALVRYLAVAAEKNKKAMHSYFNYLLKLKLWLSLTFAFILLAIAYPLAHYIFRNPALLPSFLISALYVFILSLDTFYSNIFYSVDKVGYLGIREVINQIARISLAIVVFYLVSSANQVFGVVIALILVSIILIIFSYIISKKITPEIYSKSFEKIDKSKVNRFIGYLALVGIAYMLFFYMDSLILAIFLKPEFVGYYKASFSFIFGILGFVYFSNSVFVSIFSKMKQKQMSAAFDRVIKYACILVIPSIAGLLVLGKYFIRLFYGYAYLPSAISFYFLVFVLFPALFVNLILNLFFAGEKPKILVKLILLTSLLNITLNLLFIKVFLVLASPIWATAGAAIATLISWFFYFFLSTQILQKEFKIYFPYKHIVKPLIASAIMAAAVLSYTLNIADMNAISGAIAMIIGVFIYFAVLFLLRGLHKSDFALLKIVLKNPA